MASTPSDSFHSLLATDTVDDHFAHSETNSKYRRHFSLPEHIERKLASGHKQQGLRGSMSSTRPAAVRASPEEDQEIEMKYVTDLSAEYEDENGTTVAGILGGLRGRGQAESSVVAKIFAGDETVHAETKINNKRFVPQGWLHGKKQNGTVSADEQSKVTECAKDSEVRRVLDAAVPYMTKENKPPVTPETQETIQIPHTIPRRVTTRPTTPTRSTGRNTGKEKSVFVYKPTGLQERKEETREIHECPIPIEWLTPKKHRRHTESTVLNQSSSADADDEGEAVIKGKIRKIRFADAPAKPHRNATAPNMYRTTSRKADDDGSEASSQIQITKSWNVTTEDSSMTHQKPIAQDLLPVKGESSTRQQKCDNRSSITAISAGRNFYPQPNHLPANGESSIRLGTPAIASVDTPKRALLLFPRPPRQLPKPPFPSPTATRFEVQDWIHALIKAHNLPALPKFSIYHLCFTGRDLHQIAFGNDKETGILAYEFIDQITRGKTGLSAPQAEVIHDAMIEYGGIKGKREGVWTKDGKPWEVYTSKDIRRDCGPTLTRHGHRISSRNEPIQMPKVMMEGTGEGGESGGGSKLKKMVKKVIGLRVKVKVEMSMGSDDELTDDGRPSSEILESDTEGEIEEGARN